MPTWVVDPRIEGGLAATECTRATGELSLDKTEAVALARANLAKQVRVKIKAILLVWASILLSTVFLVELAWVRLLLPGIAIGVTIYLIRLPNAEGEPDA